MPKANAIALPFSPCTGGVNRLIDEAGPLQAAEAFDVLADRGYVYRRPAINTIHTAPYAREPRDLVSVRHGVFQSTVTDLAVVTPIITSRDDFYYGAQTLNSKTQTFSGIHMPVSTTSGTPTAHRFTRALYFNGSQWVGVEILIDTTVTFDSGYRVPWSRDGIIAWRIPSDWATATVNSVQGLYVRLYLVDVTGARVSPQVQTNFRNLGVGLINFGRVTGMREVGVSGASRLIVASEADVPGKGSRSRLGVIATREKAPEPLDFLRDEGTGVFGASTYPEPLANGASTGLGTSAGPGTTGRLTKARKTQIFDDDIIDFEWGVDQFLGDIIIDDTAVQSGDSDFITFPGIGADHPDDFFKNHIAILTNAGTGSVPAGTKSEIYRSYNDGGDLVCVLVFAGTTGTSTRWSILRRADYIYLPDQDIRIQIQTNDEETATPQSAAFGGGLTPSNGHGKYAIMTRSEDVLPGGNSVIDIDPITGNALIAYGGSVLESNGVWVRELEADRTSDLARQLAGEVVDDFISFDPSAIAKTQLRRKPPLAKFILFFQNRVVLAGIRDRPYDIVYSFPGAANNVWPLLYQSQIRDETQDPITGMAVLNEQLLVFTRTAMHEGSTPDSSGVINFSPISQGYGFVSQRAVVKMMVGGSSILAGVGVDGINIWDGGTPTQALDRWDRILPRGVNTGRLDLASAAVLPRSNLAFFAVPDSGSSICNRIIVWDYVRGTFYPWRYETGAASMAVSYDTLGREALLIGTEDGFIATLTDSLFEDGEDLEGYVRTLPIDPIPGGELKPERLLVRAGIIGTSQIGGYNVLSMKLMRNDRAKAVIDSNAVVDQGQFRWFGGSYAAQSASDRTYGADAFIPTEVPTRGAQGTRLQAEFGGKVRWRIRSPFLFLQPGDNRGRS